MTTTHPTIDGLTDKALTQLVHGPDGTWALTPDGHVPVTIAGLGDDLVQLVPGEVYVQTANQSDRYRRALALLNARLRAIGVSDPQVRAILDGAGFDERLADATLSIAPQIRSLAHLGGDY